MTAALCEELPYWQFEDTPFPHVILWDGSLAAGLEILPLDIECFDEERINQLTLGIRAFANSLPEDTTCQFLVKVESEFGETIARHEALATPDLPFLRLIDAGRTSALKETVEAGAIFRPRLFLFLRTEGVAKPRAFTLKAIRKFSSDFEKNHDDRLQTLAQMRESVGSSLSGLGFQVDPLDRDGVVGLVYRYLNPNRAVTVDAPHVSPRPTDLDGDSPRNQLVFGDLILDQEDFVLDQLRTRIISLKTLPEATFAGMMSGFLSFPFRYELVFSFRVPDQAKELKSLEQKRRMAHSLANSSSNRVTDLESESRLAQTTDLIREIIETGQHIFHAELLVILRESNDSDGRRRLSLRTKEVLSRFKTLSGSEGVQETVGSWKVFSSDLPSAPVHLERAKKMKTNNLADFLPLFGPSPGHSTPVALLNTRSGGLYSFNPQAPELSNFNSLITGSSGGGKSMASNLLMLQQAARGTRVFIIDIGGSYRKLCHVLGGQYFEINLAEGFAINPLHVHDPTQPPSGERIKSLVNIIEQMIVDEGERLSRFDRVQIEKALSETFEEARRECRSPQLRDLVRCCERSGEPALLRVAKLLFPWTGDSPYGQFLDRQGHIRLGSPVVAFDLKGLSHHPDLQSVMILILTNFILDQVEHDRSVPKEVILDEAWQLLKSPAAISFMEYAARTFRKTGSGIKFITQGVEEIVASGLGPAILNNTATKLVMMQRGDTRVLRDQLKLNSQELRLIQSLEQRKGVFSEGFLMAGESRTIVRFSPTPLEYWISTSDSRDNQFLESLIAEGLSLEAALMKAAELNPLGVAFASNGAAAGFGSAA